MILPSHQTAAFHAVARTGSFTTAARELHVTQSALSQRIANLEETLRVRLFVRGRGGAKLTDAGERLLRYCDATNALEAELIDELTDDVPGRPGLTGQIRVAGFSSVLRSIALPALARIARDHPRVRIEIFVRELMDLPAMMRTSQADFVLLDQPIERADVESKLLGHESLVLVEGRRHAAPDGVYLDHDPEDRTTITYLRKNGVSTRAITRRFLDDIYGILDGVALGLGSAVVPRHLLRPPFDRALRIVPGARSVTSPVYMHYARLPSHPRLFDLVSETLVSEFAKALR